MIRSISRMPRCQERNSSFRRRTSSPSLDRVDPVMEKILNAKSPDGAGRGLYRRVEGGCQPMADGLSFVIAGPDPIRANLGLPAYIVGVGARRAVRGFCNRELDRIWGRQGPRGSGRKQEAR